MARTCKLILWLFAVPAIGANINAASSDYADVASAYSSSSAGDTIVIPAGTSTWASTLAITNSIVFQGAGSTNGSITKITRSGAAPTFTYGAANNAVIGMSGMFLVQTTDNHFEISDECRVTLSDVYWQEGGVGIEASAQCYGLAYNSRFEDINIVFRLIQAPTAAAVLAAGYDLGSTNTFVAEDCHFVWTSASDAVSPWISQASRAQRGVMRYCTVTTTNSTASLEPHDMHGKYFTWGRGSHVWEIYGNTYNLNDQSNTMLAMRGGTILFWSNTVNSADATQIFMRHRNEEYFNASYGFFNPTDQVQNTHFWSNTINGDVQSQWSPARTDASGNGALNADPDANGCVYDENEWGALWTANDWSSGVAYVEMAENVIPSYVKTGGNLYRCISGHTSGASTEPGTGGSWETVWEQDAWHLYSRKPASGDPVYDDFGGASNPTVGYQPLAYPHPLRNALIDSLDPQGRPWKLWIGVPQ